MKKLLLTLSLLFAAQASHAITVVAAHPVAVAAHPVVTVAHPSVTAAHPTEVAVAKPKTVFVPSAHVVSQPASGPQAK